MSKTDMPWLDVAQPFKPVTDSFAISLRSLRMGDLFHQKYPQNVFDWLKRYKPVERVGETILVYNISDAETARPD